MFYDLVNGTLSLKISSVSLLLMKSKCVNIAYVLLTTSIKEQ